MSTITAMRRSCLRNMPRNPLREIALEAIARRGRKLAFWLRTLFALLVLAPITLAILGNAGEVALSLASTDWASIIASAALWIPAMSLVAVIPWGTLQSMV